MSDENKDVHLGATGLQPPSPFAFTNPGEWTAWITSYEDYAFTTGLRSAWDKNASTDAALLYGPADAVSGNFAQPFAHPANEIYESRRLYRRTHQPGESVDVFFTKLPTLFRRCNYNSPEMEDRLVREKFVVGQLDEKPSDQGRFSRSGGIPF